MKYIWGLPNGDWNDGEYDTVTDCVIDARKVLQPKVNTSILVGKKEEADVSRIIRESEVVNIYALLDAIESSVQDDYEIDWNAYDYERDKMLIRKIKDTVTEILAEFFEKTGNVPPIKNITEVQEIIIRRVR